MPKKIVGISGTLSPESTSHKLLRYIQEHYKEQIDLSVFAGIETLPHFNPRIKDEDLPASVKDFRTQIANADGVLFCSPEYVFSLPGSLKNAIEWTVGSVVFSAKPVAMIIAAATGEKAFESLELILKSIEAMLPDASRLLIKGAKGKMGTDGKVNDENCQKEIEGLVLSLLASCEVERPAPSKFQD